MGGTSLTKASPLFILFLTMVLLPLMQDIYVWFIPNGFMRPPWKSAKDLMLAAFDEENLGKHPRAVYLNGSEKSTSSAESRDEKKQKKLWEETVKLARLRESDTVLKDWQ